MDRRRNPISVPGHDGPIDADTAPVATDVCRRANPDDVLARDPLEGQPFEKQVIVFCGDQQQVNQGFAIALRIMGLDADFSTGSPANFLAGFSRDDIPLTVTDPNREITK